MTTKGLDNSKHRHVGLHENYHMLGIQRHLQQNEEEIHNIEGSACKLQIKEKMNI